MARAGLGASTVSSALAGSAGAPALGAAKDAIDRLCISVRDDCCLVSNRMPSSYTARVNDLLMLPRFRALTGP